MNSVLSGYKKKPKKPKKPKRLRAQGQPKVVASPVPTKPKRRSKPPVARKVALADLVPEIKKEEVKAVQSPTYNRAPTQQQNVKQDLVPQQAPVKPRRPSRAPVARKVNLSDLVPGVKISEDLPKARKNSRNIPPEIPPLPPPSPTQRTQKRGKKAKKPKRARKSNTNTTQKALDLLSPSSKKKTTISKTKHHSGISALTTSTMPKKSKGKADLVLSPSKLKRQQEVKKQTIRTSDLSENIAYPPVKPRTMDRKGRSTASSNQISPPVKPPTRSRIGTLEMVKSPAPKKPARRSRNDTLEVIKSPPVKPPRKSRIGSRNDDFIDNKVSPQKPARRSRNNTLEMVKPPPVIPRIESYKSTLESVKIQPIKPTRRSRNDTLEMVKSPPIKPPRRSRIGTLEKGKSLSEKPPRKTKLASVINIEELIVPPPPPLEDFVAPVEYKEKVDEFAVKQQDPSAASLLLAPAFTKKTIEELKKEQQQEQMSQIASTVVSTTTSINKKKKKPKKPKRVQRAIAAAGLTLQKSQASSSKLDKSKTFERNEVTIPTTTIEKVKSVPKVQTVKEKSLKRDVVKPFVPKFEVKELEMPPKMIKKPEVKKVKTSSAIKKTAATTYIEKRNTEVTKKQQLQPEEEVKPKVNAVIAPVVNKNRTIPPVEETKEVKLTTIRAIPLIEEEIKEVEVPVKRRIPPIEEEAKQVKVVPIRAIPPIKEESNEVVVPVKRAIPPIEEEVVVTKIVSTAERPIPPIKEETAVAPRRKRSSRRRKKSRRIPNSGGVEVGTSADLKKEFQSKSKFRESFWKVKKKAPVVRQSLALMRRGNKLKPMNFNQNNNNSGKLENKGLEGVKSQYQISKFRQSFWTKKNSKERKPKEDLHVKRLNTNQQAFANMLENTLNKKGEAKEAVDVGELDVNQNLFGSGAEMGDDGMVDYSKYIKMFKFKLPDGAIRQAMYRAKMDDKDVEYFFEKVREDLGSLEPPNTALLIPEGEGPTVQLGGEVKMLEKAGMVDYKKYCMMAKNKLPEGAIIQSMCSDQLSQDNQDFFLANIDQVHLILPPAKRFPKLNLEEQRGEWDYTKYKKMIKIKVPEPLIRRDMASDGLSEENIEFFFANLGQLNLLTSEEEVAPAPVRPNFLSAIEGFKSGGNGLNKPLLSPPPMRKTTLKKPVKEKPDLLSELKLKMQRKTRKEKSDI